MHALALEFTYLWKLNREHWLKVWPHICIWPQLWTGTSARTRAHAAHTHMGTWLWTAGSVCSASGSFLLLSVSHNDPCTVCVCTAPSSNSVHFRPIAIQAHSQAGFCEDAHKPGKAWPQAALGKTGAKFIEKSTRMSEMHLIHFALCCPLRQMIMFWHSNQGHRNISRAIFHFLQQWQPQRQSCC